MLECEGFKMFRGTALVRPKTINLAVMKVSGVWLYKPEFDCWYVGGRSYPAEIVEIVKDETP